MQQSRIDGILFTPTNNVRLTLKPCVRCKHFVSRPEDSKLDLQHRGKCSLFGYINPITGEETLASATMCRSEIHFCTVDAKYFAPILEETM